MKNAVFNFPLPANEPVKSYLKGSPERVALEAELKRQSSVELDIPLIIGGKEVRTGNTGKVVMPHDHAHVLATYHKAGPEEVRMAIKAALDAHEEWAELDWTVRASIMLKIADLLAGKYRAVINAACMLGQSKNFYQAEIDSACETIDFLRYNAAFASKIYGIQPKSGPNQINSVEYRPLEGFIFALTPFNFTSIASNLSMSPALMGNTVVWKPSTTAILSNYYLMKIYEEAGVPAGVVNFIPGSGAVIGKEIFASKDLAGVHFTGSSATFNTLWKQVGENIANYRSYPRLVGETGGKDFIFVHPSAVAEEVGNAAYCGAFEYQGQKCSAASRMYVPKSLWPAVLEKIKDTAAKVRPRHRKTLRSCSAAGTTSPRAISWSLLSSSPQIPISRAWRRRYSAPSSQSTSMTTLMWTRLSSSATPPRLTALPVPSGAATVWLSRRFPAG